MSIQRINRGRGHSYIDTDTGLKIPGVTTIIGDGIPKPNLLKWSAETTANYAVDHWEDLTTKAASVRLKELYGARFAERDTAGNRGTKVHQLAERLVTGEKVAVPDELAGHVQSYVQFLDDYDVAPILVEAIIWSEGHNYCGTLDLVADLTHPDEKLRWLLDIKTSRSGVFGEAALQLAAYRYADRWIDDEGGEHDMPQVDAVGAVHVRADGYDLIPVEAGPEQHRQFLYAQQIANFLAHARDLVGEPAINPATSVYRLVRDDT